jgi:hypothetical protein
MLLDVDQPQSARCRVISAPDETAAKPPFGTPSVLWTGEGFVTAWIRADGKVRACELGSFREPPLIIDVGEDADVDRPLRQLLYSDAEYVTFIWKERGGGFVERRMPKNVTGHAFATDLWRLLCAASQWVQGKSPAQAQSRPPAFRNSASRISFNAIPNSR